MWYRKKSNEQAAYPTRTLSAVPTETTLPLYLMFHNCKLCPTVQYYYYYYHHYYYY